MYTLKPVVTDFDVDKPTNMYSIKEINPKEDHFLAKLEYDLKVDKVGDLRDLEQKQTFLLEKLKDLKRQLVSLQEGLPICRKPAQPRPKFPRDLVISVDPTAIPYSLLLMLKQDRVPISFSVNFYAHSTVTAVPEDAVEFAKEIEALSHDKGVPLTVVWREGRFSNFEVFVSPTVSFWGEGNLIRYLTRIGVLEQSSEINDELLDLAYQLSITRETSKQTKIVNCLKRAMLKQKRCQTVDFVVYSAIKNYRNKNKAILVAGDGVLNQIEERL